MKRQAETIIAIPTAAPPISPPFCPGNAKVPTLAKTTQHPAIHTPPMISGFLLPTLSTKHKPGIVQTTFTPARIVCVTNGSERPTEVKRVVEEEIRA